MAAAYWSDPLLDLLLKKKEKREVFLAEITTGLVLQSWGRTIRSV